MVRLLNFVGFFVGCCLRQCAVVLFLGCLLSVSTRAEVRQWNAVTGETMDAEFVKMSGSTVIFRRDNKLERHPLEILSEADQAYIGHIGPRGSRDWFVDGRSLRGTFQSYAADKVTLRIGANDREVPLGQFSSADQSHIRGILDHNNELSALPEDDPLKMVAAPADSETRLSKTWTDKKGRQITAEFVRVEDDKVVLRRTKDGKELAVPLSKLSDEDQAVAQKRQADFVVSSPAPSAEDDQVAAAEQMRQQQQAEQEAQELQRLAEAKRQEEQLQMQQKAEEERRRATELAEQERLKAEALRAKQLAEEQQRLAEEQAQAATEAARMDQAADAEDAELAALDEDDSLYCPACDAAIATDELGSDGEHCPHCGVNFVEHFQEQFQEEFSGGSVYRSYRRTRRLIRFGIFIVLGVLGLLGKLFAGRE